MHAHAYSCCVLDNVGMVQLTQESNFSNRRGRDTKLAVVIEGHALQRHNSLIGLVNGFEHASICAFAQLLQHLKVVQLLFRGHL